MGLSVGRAVGWVGRVEKAQTTTYGAPVGVTVFRFNSVRYRGGVRGGHRDRSPAICRRNSSRSSCPITPTT